MYRESGIGLQPEAHSSDFYPCLGIVCIWPPIIQYILFYSKNIWNKLHHSVQDIVIKYEINYI